MTVQSLYHFTSLFNLPGIVKRGLREGELAMTKYKGNDVVSLTKSPTPTMAFWGGVPGPYDKLKVRITAQVEQGPQLMRWRDAIRKYGCRLAMQKVLDPYNDGHNWLCYFGTIPPSSLGIEVRRKSDYQRVDGSELVELVANIEREQSESWIIRRESDGLYVQLKDGVRDSWLLDGGLRGMILANQRFR